MIEWLESVWNTISPYLVGTALGTTALSIVTAVICRLIKETKSSDSNIAEKVVDGVSASISGKTQKHTIQPIVVSEVKKVQEEVDASLQKKYDELQAKYDKIIAIMEAQAKYFDNSVGVTEESKEALRNAVADAKSEPTEVVEEIVVEPKEEKKETTTNVIR